MKKRMILIISFVIVAATGILYYESYLNSPFMIFAHHENLDESLRERLIDCLGENKIQYEVDANGSVLIRERDQNKAVITCS
ncbi:hypothetical protein CEN49_15105 [Fischerella thermalis CCMEE 5273]|nr:hypothetical protein CEN49_15105 [Fischerella thermalis CCMEE 5273]